jgi:hypothetical protein
MYKVKHVAIYQNETDAIDLILEYRAYAVDRKRGPSWPKEE